MTTPTKEDDEPSYIDYETFLSPDFSASSFANTLVLSTNNPDDAPLDLSTPLSRVLFDIQEIDSHIDLLTTRSAVPLLTHTKEQTDSSTRIVAGLDGQIKALNDSYRQLEEEVIQKHAEAEQVHQVASRLWQTLRLGRAVGRCLQLGRQLEIQHAELTGSASSTTTTTTTAAPKRENHRVLVRCAETILSLRELLSNTTDPSAEGFGLDRIKAIRALRTGYLEPTERSVREGAERIVREFSIGAPAGSGSTATATATFAQAEETRARTVSALHALYLLSLPTGAGQTGKIDKWTPTLMLHALEVYLRTALQSSIAGLSRALASLPTLDRALAETAARCQNVVALEAVLEGARPPVIVTAKQLPEKEKENLLRPLLAYLETGSLASYFWRTMASSLSPRVQEIVARGGAPARTLRANRNGVGEAVRECVARGSRLPGGAVGARKGKEKDGGEGTGAWEREVAVMVGSVVGNLGR